MRSARAWLLAPPRTEDHEFGLGFRPSKYFEAHAALLRAGSVRELVDGRPQVSASCGDAMDASDHQGDRGRRLAPQPDRRRTRATPPAPKGTSRSVPGTTAAQRAVRGEPLVPRGAAQGQGAHPERALDPRARDDQRRVGALSTRDGEQTGNKLSATQPNWGKVNPRQRATSGLRSTGSLRLGAGRSQVQILSPRLEGLQTASVVHPACWSGDRAREQVLRVGKAIGGSSPSTHARKCLHVVMLTISTEVPNRPMGTDRGSVPRV